MAVFRKLQRDGNIPELTAILADLVGGVDLNASPTALPPSKAQELRNFSLEEAGALVTVEGWEEFLDAALTTGGGADRIQGGERIYLDDGVFTLLAYEGGIYDITDPSLPNLVLAGLDGDNEIFFPSDGKVVLVMDGFNRPSITADGTNYFDAGIDAPVSAPTLAVSAGGSLIDTNEYEVSYTFGTSAAFDPNLVHESNESPRDSIVAATPDLTIDVSAMGSDDPKVDTVYVYARNLTAGQAVRRLVDTVANTDSSTPWTASFDTEPSELQLAPPDDAGLPEAFRFGIFYGNRWWGFHPTIKNRLHFSQVFQPQSWPSTFYVDLSLERGDELASLVPLGELLTVLGKTNIFLLSAPSVLEIDVRAGLSVETGALGPRAALRVEDGVLHAGTAGVYLFNGAQDQNVSKDIQAGWRDLIANATPIQLSRVAMTYLQRLNHVHVAVPRLSLINAPGEYVLDRTRTRARQNEAWFRTNRDIGGYISWNGNEPSAGDYGRLLSWELSGGMVHEERVGGTANGGNLTAVYLTPGHTTQFRETNAVSAFVEFEPAEGSLTMDLFVGGVIVSTQVFNVEADVDTYGDAEYGFATYGGSSRRKLPIMLPLPADGTEFYIRWTFQGTSRFKMFSYGYGILPEAVIRTLQ